MSEFLQKLCKLRIWVKSFWSQVYGELMVFVAPGEKKGVASSQEERRFQSSGCLRLLGGVSCVGGDSRIVSYLQVLGELDTGSNWLLGDLPRILRWYLQHLGLDASCCLWLLGRIWPLGPFYLWGQLVMVLPLNLGIQESTDRSQVARKPLKSCFERPSTCWHFRNNTCA